MTTDYVNGMNSLVAGGMLIRTFAISFEAKQLTIVTMYENETP